MFVERLPRLKCNIARLGQLTHARLQARLGEELFYFFTQLRPVRRSAGRVQQDGEHNADTLPVWRALAVNTRGNARSSGTVRETAAGCMAQ